MTVFNNTNKIRVDCSTATSVDFNFKIFKASELIVSLINKTTAEETPLTLNTDYTISISKIADGGTIYLNAAHPGYYLYAIRKIDYIQPEDIPTEGGFPEETIEDAFDRGCILSQQLKELADRSIKLKGFLESTETDENGIDVELPIPSPNKLFMWDSDGKSIVNSTVDVPELESMAERLYASADNIDTVAGSITNVNACADNETNINACASNGSNITACANNESNINACVGNEDNINACVNNATNINACVSNSANINACVANKDNINACVNNSTNINACVNNATNINACVSNASNINACVNNASNINTCVSNMESITNASANAATAAQKAAEAATSATLAESYKNDIAAFDFVDGGYSYTTPLNTYDGGSASNGDLDILEGSDAHGLDRITFDDMQNINRISEMLLKIKTDNETISAQAILIKELQENVKSLTNILQAFMSNIDGGSATV